MKKSGAWFTFDEDQLGQGREKAKRFLRENPEIAMQLQAKVYDAVGLGDDLTDEPEAIAEPVAEAVAEAKKEKEEPAAAEE